MGAAATTAPPVSMNIATTRSIVNTAARQAMALAATIHPRRSTATALAATNASGAAPPPTAPAASTARPASMRSKHVRRKRKDEDETACRFNVSAAGKALDVRFSHWHKGLCCAT